MQPCSEIISTSDSDQWLPQLYFQKKSLNLFIYILKYI